jgi:minor histocompatibility antigen H13
MVNVATSLDLPMKILWPKSIRFSLEYGTMMLGLGDIVVPGTFISLALRYDHFRHTKSQQEKPFAKPYFIASVVAYVTGLATTMAVMHVFHAAQPALLYLRCVILCDVSVELLPTMEIVRPVSCRLYSPPGAAGSFQKLGNGMMGSQVPPKMGT